MGLPILAKKINFSDEFHFDQGGYVNKQNCRIWGTENPHGYIEKPTHPQLVTVLCGFWSRGIIGQFFENEQGEAVTVNGDRYRTMLNEFLFTKIEEKNTDICFQQDGATCHTAEVTLDVVRPVFEDSIISRRAEVISSPRSCDLRALDNYLWSAVKDKGYADKPETIDALKDNICEAIGEIQLLSIGNVLKNWTDRVGYCMASRGNHFKGSYFPLLTRRIVLSNKKKLEKIFSSFF